MSDELSDEELLKLDFKKLPAHLRGRYISALGRRGKKLPGGALELSNEQVKEIASIILEKHPEWFEKLLSTENEWWSLKGWDCEDSNPALFPLIHEFDQITKPYLPPNTTNGAAFLWLRRAAIEKLRKQ